MSGPYTEDNLVQRTTVEFLERELGWRSVYAMHETLGPEWPLASFNEIVFDVLRQCATFARQFRVLAAARDALLPRTMKGGTA